ncbi:MAG: YggS family pyridoxal phosphate-dependent enzyme [Planctomycetota bacterium]
MADLGENRAVEGAAKVEAVAAAGDAPVWHFIGHLQRNKAARVWAHFDWIHSVDSLRLLEQLAQCGEQSARRPRLLLQVNMAGESQKHGLTPAELPAVVERAAALPQCDVAGLMCMAPLAEEAEASRPVFRALRELRDGVAVRSGVELPELSMGMSQDFEIAVEEGATLVRVGTALTSSLRGAAA